MPSDIAASWRLSATRGTLLDAVLTATSVADGSTERKRKALTEEERDATDPWLTLAEIAEELRVNPATVRQWVTRGQLHASRAGVRKWIVRRSELERMLAATRPAADPSSSV